MLSLHEYIALKERLIQGEINTDEAKSRLWENFKDGKRAWHTKDWKERRRKFLKDKCEICDSKETLTVQHLSHPKKFIEYTKEITRSLTKEFIHINSEIDKAQLEEHVKNNYTYEPIQLCPNCLNRKPNIRTRKSPKFLCTKCEHEFNEPSYLSVEELISIFYRNPDAIEVRDKCFTSKDKWHNQHNLNNIKYWHQRSLVQKSQLEYIEKKALLLYLVDTIKYLSFEDAITACKICASRYDLHQMDLCPECKKHYKGIKYDTCISCLPESRKNEVLEKLSFNKEMMDIHRNFGID
ncbi:MAG: hypothetical protein EP332_00090 [Bacteroidetes bacterium]|nr:MAG: hypothetical protein EP332_00090 [Bacteroidota bacterium]